MTTDRSTSPLRRRLLIGAAAAAGLTGGAWLALGRNKADPVLDGLWSMSFATPDGGSLAMNSLLGKPLLINFWATWCAPCVREMPVLDRFYVDFRSKGWQVLGLAVDSPTPVRTFLGRVKVSFPIGMAGLEGSELSKRLGNERGGLPFSVAFDRQGRATQRKLGETSYEELAAWAKDSR